MRRVASRAGREQLPSGWASTDFHDFFTADTLPVGTPATLQVFTVIAPTLRVLQRFTGWDRTKARNRSAAGVSSPCSRQAMPISRRARTPASGTAIAPLSLPRTAPAGSTATPRPAPTRLSIVVQVGRLEGHLRSEAGGRHSSSVTRRKPKSGRSATNGSSAASASVDPAPRRPTDGRAGRAGTAAAVRADASRTRSGSGRGAVMPISASPLSRSLDDARATAPPAARTGSPEPRAGTPSAGPARRWSHRVHERQPHSARLGIESARRSAAGAESTAAVPARAASSTIRPYGLSRNPRCSRSNSRTPKASSTRRSDRDRFGWLVPSAAAASVSRSVSASTTNQRRSSTCIRIPYRFTLISTFYVCQRIWHRRRHADHSGDHHGGLPAR